ncbi:MAG: tetratricopeptide repeat protein [Ardenticatenia bacterium]|nr:tetratricopeptide repeat protein [Ardenticatenia bacterium]
MGNYYIEKEAWEQALEALSKATEVAPDDVQAWSGLAYVYTRMGDLQAAVEANLQVLAISPNDFITHRNLALIYRDLGDMTNALIHAQRALDVAPENERANMQAFVVELQQLAAEQSRGG